MKKLLALLSLALGSAVFAADQVPLFNAMLSIGKEHRFVLVGPAGKASGFLKLGESFEGYALKNYDAKTGVLELERDGKLVQVTLVADAAVASAAAATPATLQDATALLDSMNFEEMLDKTMVGLRRQQAQAMGQMVSRMAPPGADQETREAVAAFQRKMVEEMMGDLTGAALKADVAKIYSEVFSKEELQGLGAFYQTPVGQAMNNKQPELTEKMNAVMMTRIMSAMPRVQQMAQQFGAEMRAKREAARAENPAPAPAPKQ